MTFGERLCQQRKAKGLSQEQFAEKLQVSRQAVSKWETGEAQPDMAKLLLIRDILDIPLDALCGGDTKQENRITSAPVKRFNMLCALLLAAGLIFGLAGGYFLFGGSAKPELQNANISATATASPVREDTAPIFDNLEISSFAFYPQWPIGDTYRTLQVVFSPSISRNDFSYTVVKTDSYGETTSYPAVYSDGICTCDISAYYYEGFLLTVMISDGTNTYSAALVKFTDVSENSFGYEELWNKVS